MNIVAIKKAPSDLASHLRAMADMADEGRITSVVIAYICDGNYEFTYGSSLSDGIVMSALLHQNCIDRMRA